MTDVSVVIPVKDGARYLDEVLAAVARENPAEVLVIDSGSRDGSAAIARRAGADVVRIAPEEFGHGRTRNLGVEHTTAELICFLTQDATPCPGWLAAYAEAFTLHERVGAAYGPHLPRATTSPMIARELEEFFGAMSPDGRPRVQQAGDSAFLSNANACYARRCWQEVRFRDLAYAEDQAFGADMLAMGWMKVYHPGAAVLHAHDYPPLEFMRRYFEEYRGLRASIGHVEPFGVRSNIRHVSRSVAGDRRWLASHGVGGGDALRWSFRSLLHHSGRQVFSALGSRADALPPSIACRLSHERRTEVPVVEAGVQPTAADDLPVRSISAKLEADYFAAPYRVWSEGPAPMRAVAPGMSTRERLRIAMVIPIFTRGSGGHLIVLQILDRLARRGHVCSVWLHDYLEHETNFRPGKLRHDIREFFAPFEGAAYNNFEQWHGADVVIATGWQTVHPALLLPDCHARVYIVNDHETEFFGTSVERVLAADTYRHGMHCIAGTPWLHNLLSERYGASADTFQMGVDHDIYRPRDTVRRRDTVIYYARQSTPRRAVPVGLAALGELHRRRPDLRIVLFGNEAPIRTTFPYEHAGVLSASQLALLYSQATVGLCLSLTNFSLMPKEMLACGLPCVELAGVSAESTFGAEGPIELAELQPAPIADAIERLLEDPDLWDRRSRQGIELVASHTWEHATDQVEAGIRHALRLREMESATPLRPEGGCPRAAGAARTVTVAKSTNSRNR